MTPQLWIGFGFLALLIFFLIVAYFKGEAKSQSQYNTLRFLTALCAGFAGAFIAGDALFKMDYKMSNGAVIAISGTAGFAAFFLIWLSYPKLNLLEGHEGYVIAVPEGWAFKDVVEKAVKAAGGNVDFRGFTNEELQLSLMAGTVRRKTLVLALAHLRNLQSTLPEYIVSRPHDTNIFILEKK